MGPISQLSGPAKGSLRRWRGYDVDQIGCGSWIELDWVSKYVNWVWVGLDLAKWTHVQLCDWHITNWAQNRSRHFTRRDIENKYQQTSDKTSQQQMLSINNAGVFGNKFTCVNTTSGNTEIEGWVSEWADSWWHFSTIRQAIHYTVPFTSVHGGKYRTEDKLKIQTIHKLKTTPKRQTKQN